MSVQHHPLATFVAACQHASLARLMKLADAAVVKPRIETFVFSPDGKLYIKRDPSGRRFALPSIPAAKVPYEEGVRFIPPSGVDEPGVHGYEVQFHHVDADDDMAAELEGYEAVDPDEALRELYAAVGKPENRIYRDVYRARIRALLRLLKKRRQALEARQPIQESVSDGSIA